MKSRRLRPPEDVDELFATYHDTLSLLRDKHALMQLQRVLTWWSEPSYNGDCRASKRLTHRLKHTYCRHSDSTPHLRWQMQFHNQRLLFRSKAKSFWLTMISDCQHDPRKLESKINQLLNVDRPPAYLNTAADFTEHFASKIDNVRASTAMAAPHTVVIHPSEPLALFQPDTTKEAAKLLNRAPTKHCELDPVPTWLIK